MGTSKPVEIPPEVAKLTADEIIAKTRVLSNEVLIQKNITVQVRHDSDQLFEKIRVNILFSYYFFNSASTSMFFRFR